MNKLIFTFAAALLLAACGDDSSSTSAGDTNSTNTEESSNNFVDQDVSEFEFSFSISENFKMDDGAIHITNADGNKSKSTLNWVLSKDYTHLVACGFVASIKIGENMNYTGIQLFKKDSYDNYQFDIFADGRFAIRAPEKKILELAKDSSHVKTGEYNEVAVKTTDAGDVKVSVNGTLVKTIAKNDMEFTLTETDKIAVDYNVKSTASEKTPAEAWVKMKSIEKEK